MSDTQLETARNIHDQLCQLIEYSDDESADDDDTAIGALLSGRANCDGYADAFYLVGSIAGLHVRYQHGNSFQMLTSVPGYPTVTHMWNLLELDGTWRLVDVTWDDQQDMDAAYTWFNIGADRAARTHIWNPETSVALLEYTDLASRPANEFMIQSDTDLDRAVKSALSTKSSSFSFYYQDTSDPDVYQDALELLSRHAQHSFQYIWDPHMFMLTCFGL